MSSKKTDAKVVETISIKPPNIKTLQFQITGTSPLMQARFSKKQELMDNMAAGATAKSKKVRKARDYDADFKSAMHISSDGWNGHPASAFRNACIDACRLVGFKMVQAKMSIFVRPEGFDSQDGSPLVRINGSKPERSEMAARNANGSTDIRVRPMWRTWNMTLNMQYDADQFTAQDVANLLERAGQQVGIGEGRHFSRESYGMGFGTFTIKGRKEVA